MSKIIVANSEFSQTTFDGKTFSFSYSLPQTLQVQGPHFARLLWINPRPKYPVFVFCDFVGDSFVDGQPQPWLGCSGSPLLGSVIPWVRITRTTIPETGLFQIKQIGDADLPAHPKFCVIVQIASLAWVNGTSS
jgi:hypothetical protein